MDQLWDVVRRSPITHFFLAVSIFSSAFCINIMQVLLYAIKPLDKELFQSLMYYLQASFLSQIVFIADYWADCELILYCSKEDFEALGKEHTLALINHKYEIDWLFGWSFLSKIGTLGNTRGFIKKIIKYIPFAGWMFGLADHVFLERSFEKDKKTIEVQLTKYMEYKSSAWLVMTSEGTRFTKSKHEASQIFAKEHNLAPLKHHLIPRTKGFTTCLPILKKKCPTITNLQLGIVPSDNQPTFGNLLKGHKQVAHLYCKRISIEEVPEDEKAAAAWLHKIYQEKDLQQESFVEHGNFCHVDPTIKPITLKPRLSVLVNTLLWMFVTIVPIFYYILKLLFSGEFLFFFVVGGGVFSIFYFMMQKAIGHTKISKASSYGKKD